MEWAAVRHGKTLFSFTRRERYHRAVGGAEIAGAALNAPLPRRLEFGVRLAGRICSGCQALWQADGALGTALAYQQHTNSLQQFHGSEFSFRQPGIGQMLFGAAAHGAGKQ